jgi:hypothetical protein
MVRRWSSIGHFPYLYYPILSRDTDAQEHLQAPFPFPTDAVCTEAWTDSERRKDMQIRHHVMHVGAEVPGALGATDEDNVEEGANAASWLFGGHTMVVRMHEGCVQLPRPRLPPRQPTCPCRCTIHGLGAYPQF